MPQNDAGWRIEPPVSVPSAPAQRPAATAAALPPLLPPGARRRSQGLRVTWNALFSVEEPIANSSRFSLPRTTAPAARRRVDDGRVAGRHEAFEHPAAAGRAQASGEQVVLEADGHTRQRAEGLAGTAPRVDAFGLGQRPVGVHRQVGPERRVQASDPIEVMARRLDRRDSPVRDGVAQGAESFGHR
jgi:hypothetical protein